MSHNRATALRRSHGLAFNLIMCGGLNLLASGCSLSFPIAGFVSDPTATGSVDRFTVLMSHDLDQEDWRRARAALAVALDPQGNGALVTWANPASGARGSFAASAPPFPKRDQVCRAFTAHVTQVKTIDRDVEGSACREGGGDWIVAELREPKKAES